MLPHARTLRTRAAYDVGTLCDFDEISKQIHEQKHRFEYVCARYLHILMEIAIKDRGSKTASMCA